MIEVGDVRGNDLRDALVRFWIPSDKANGFPPRDKLLEELTPDDSAGPEDRVHVVLSLAACKRHHQGGVMPGRRICCSDLTNGLKVGGL